MKKKVKKPKEKETQLDLGIKEPFKNKFFKVKGKADKVARRIEARKALKDPLTWGVIIISIVLIFTQGFLICSNFDKMPSLLPIFQYQIQNTSKLVDKWYLLVYPGISISTLVLSIIFTSKYYSRETNLSKLLNVVALLNTLAMTVILIDLINRF
jgi:hypothetical protein